MAPASKGVIMMNVVFNSEHYAIFAYPTEHGYELVDKAGGRSLFMQGLAAERFGDAVRHALDEDRDGEAVEDYLDSVTVGAACPIILQ